MSKKILLADDDEDLAYVIKEFLVAHDFTVCMAHEGLKVVEMVSQEKPDLVVLDWKMPIGKGSAVLEMLRENEATKKVPVIILSGMDEPGIRRTAKAMGVDVFIKKPHENKNLLKHIRAILKL